MAIPRLQRLPDEYLSREGSCTSCGFLALWTNEGDLWAADENWRLSGETASHKILERRLPFCAAFRANFRREMDSHLRTTARTPPVDEGSIQARIEHPWPEDVLALIAEEERHCKRTDTQLGWFRWHPGFDPREHREILDREFMLKREDARDAAMQAREDARDERIEKHHREQLSQARGLHKRELIVLGFLVTIALIAGGIASAAIEAGLWTPPYLQRQVSEVVIVTPTPTLPTPTSDTSAATLQPTP